jgi:hypothetical protein
MSMTVAAFKKKWARYQGKESAAYELAQVTVQIGYLQWRRDNGFNNHCTPVLQNLGGFQNEDALLVPHFRIKARTLKEAQADEQAEATPSRMQNAEGPG